MAYTRSAVGLGLAGETLAAGLCKTLPHAPVLRVAVNTLVASLAVFPCPSSPFWLSLAGLRKGVFLPVYLQLFLNIRGNKGLRTARPFAASFPSFRLDTPSSKLESADIRVSFVWFGLFDKLYIALGRITSAWGCWPNAALQVYRTVEVRLPARTPAPLPPSPSRHLLRRHLPPLLQVNDRRRSVADAASLSSTLRSPSPSVS